ncbi:apoptotic chromatin condensation inducer in the nucleus [Discoglossus pictus]
MKRLKGALCWENLQKHSTPHPGFQPNSQMGEEMGQNSFIKQYLEKQQELLRQRLQREAREAAETGEPSADSEDEMLPPDILPEPSDLICSVLKVPEVEVGKRAPKKCRSVLEEPEESDEELPRKRERRSSRVKQTRTPKSPVISQPVLESEQRRASTRVRRSKGDSAPTREEAEEAGEDEEEIEEEKEVKPVKDEEEIPRRRRSSTRATTPQQPKRSPVVKRSPSPPELRESSSRITLLETKETTEERVPPLLPIEGARQQLFAEKQLSPLSEKAGPPHLLIPEGTRAQRSPQKWGRQSREKAEIDSEPASRRNQESCVIRPTPNWRQESEKTKAKRQESPLSEEKESTPVSIKIGPISKDVKASPALVLMKPPVCGKSEGKKTVGSQSLHIVEKPARRGVQAMSILEKQDPSHHAVKEENISMRVPGCPEIDVSEIKPVSVLHKPESEKSDLTPTIHDKDVPKSEKLQESSIAVPAVSKKARKLKSRAFGSFHGQANSDVVKSRVVVEHDLPEVQIPEISKELPKVLDEQSVQPQSDLNVSEQTHNKKDRGSRRKTKAEVTFQKPPEKIEEEVTFQKPPEKIEEVTFQKPPEKIDEEVTFQKPPEKIEEEEVTFQKPPEKIEEEEVTFQKPPGKIEEEEVTFQKPPEKIEEEEVTFQKPPEKIEEEEVTFQKPPEKIEEVTFQKPLEKVEEEVETFQKPLEKVEEEVETFQKPPEKIEEETCPATVQGLSNLEQTGTESLIPCSEKLMEETTLSVSCAPISEITRENAKENIELLPIHPVNEEVPLVDRAEVEEPFLATPSASEDDNVMQLQKTQDLKPVEKEALILQETTASVTSHETPSDKKKDVQESPSILTPGIKVLTDAKNTEATEDTALTQHETYAEVKMVESTAPMDKAPAIQEEFLENRSVNKEAPVSVTPDSEKPMKKQEAFKASVVLQESANTIKSENITSVMAQEDLEPMTEDINPETIPDPSNADNKDSAVISDCVVAHTVPEHLPEEDMATVVIQGTCETSIILHDTPELETEEEKKPLLVQKVHESSVIVSDVSNNMEVTDHTSPAVPVAEKAVTEEVAVIMHSDAESPMDTQEPAESIPVEVEVPLSVQKVELPLVVEEVSELDKLQDKSPTDVQESSEIFPTDLPKTTETVTPDDNIQLGVQEVCQVEKREVSEALSEIPEAKSEVSPSAVHHTVLGSEIVKSFSPSHSPLQEKITEDPSVCEVLSSNQEVVAADSTTVVEDGSTEARGAPTEQDSTESECPMDTPVETSPSPVLQKEEETNLSPDIKEPSETTEHSTSKAQMEGTVVAKSYNLPPEDTVHPIAGESLPEEDLEVEGLVELQKAAEEEERPEADTVRASLRKRSSSSSSSSSTSSSSSRSTRSSAERSSHSRHSSRSRSSSPGRHSRTSRSSSSSSSSSRSRSSSSHSDRADVRRISPLKDSPEPTRVSSPPLQETSQPLISTSPPPPSKAVRLQRDLLPPRDSTSQQGRGERPRLQQTSEEPAQDEHTKRTRLEQEAENQDQKSPVPVEHEVGEDQSPGDENVAPDTEDVVMEAVENQAEGEPQEAAPPQPAEERSEGDDKKESTTPPRTFKRKISVISATKGSSQPPAAPTTNSDSEGAHPARRRRWGASTATTQKKPSISISTDSLKSLIPEIKEIKQEAVVDLHADDTRISEDESERNGDENSHDKGLKICRTVTQVVPAEVQENGQGEEEEESEEATVPEPEPAPMEVEVDPPSEQEVKKPPAESPPRAEVRVTLGDTLLRRSISQQKTGVSITIDDPVRTASQLPSPPRRKVSCIVHVCNLVRPFTLGQLKELLSRTGTLQEEHFWIDKIKSHCYVTYATVEEAVSTRNSLHGVKWPQSNPKFLSVDFAEQDELDFHRGLLVERPPEPKQEEPPHPHPHVPPPRSEHREHERGGVREQWAEREREMERRERTRSEREWDRDKIREDPRSRSRDRRRKEHAKSKEKKNEKKEKVQEEPPAKLLDDLFHKTKAAPCIYWLPLTDDQILKKVAEREERAKEREKRRKEKEEQEEEERKERAKEREKEAERNRERAREAEKRREHSRERPRERERRDPKRHSRSRSRSTPVRDRGGRR